MYRYWFFQLTRKTGSETESESNCRIIRFDSIRLDRIESNTDPVESNRVESNMA